MNIHIHVYIYIFFFERERDIDRHAYMTYGNQFAMPGGDGQQKVGNRDIAENVINLFVCLSIYTYKHTCV